MKKFQAFILLLVIILLNINILGKVQVIDVGQGDAILIQKSFEGDKILIDTGPPDANEELIDFLNNRGINKIDYLILTHNHADHVGNAIEILENFKVENIIVNKNFNNLDEIKEQNKKLLTNVNIIEVDNYLETDIGYFYASNKKYEEVNNNSLIFYTKLGFNDWLFMGDAEKEVEEEFLQKYNLETIDYVKIGHHGSNTSTTLDFLEETTPKEVFISCGRDNMYGHPSNETIDKLEEKNITYSNTQTEGEIDRYFF